MRMNSICALLGSVALGVAMPAASQAATIELALAIDTSGSIGLANFNLQKQGYINALSDLSVLARDGSVAIGIYQFSTNVSTLFTMKEITNANFASLISALNGMTYNGGSTNIAGALTTATADIFGNNVQSTRQVIDVSTDGFNNIGNLATARSNALAAGIDQINCLAIGSPTDCPDVQGGTGSFSVVANDFGDFEATLRTKIIRETTGAVPEPATWAMMLAGFGIVGSAMRRRRRYNMNVSFI
ncbi:MAG: DUF1194 domain-containing protein [Sphingomonadales bacterium]